MGRYRKRNTWSKRKGMFIYSETKRPVTEAEKKEYEYLFAKEKARRARDELCGFM